MSRKLSLALIAHFQTLSPDRKLLRAKLHEFLAERWADDEGVE